jgi:hypothetical protein
LLLLGACALAPDDDPRLTAAIKAHYAAHAAEEQGACRRPRIDSIQERRRVARPAEDNSEVLEVRYSYFDRAADMDADWSRLAYLGQPCGGIAERRFVIRRGAAGYEVIGMSGERRDGERRR